MRPARKDLFLRLQRFFVEEKRPVRPLFGLFLT